MDIFRLDHANLRTNRLAELIDWYGKVLEMLPGERPPFSFPGAWLYRHGKALVHLVEVDHEAKNEDLKLEHFALQARGLESFIQNLEAHGQTYKMGKLPGFGIVQVNIWDPDGNHIHVDFPREEGEALGVE